MIQNQIKKFIGYHIVMRIFLEIFFFYCIDVYICTYIPLKCKIHFNIICCKKKSNFKVTELDNGNVAHGNCYWEVI